MNRRIVGTMLVAAGIFAGYVHANNNSGENSSGNDSSGGGLSATLTGFNEVPLAILSPGTGTLDLTINESGGTINYTLSYSGLTNPVTQAHIHFGQKHVTGGVIAFLCSNLSGAPAGVPACPQFEGTVSGTITASNVVAIEQQNVPAGDFNALVAAITAKTAYANVHTTKFPAGELRGQIKRKSNGKDDRGNNHGNSHD